MTEAEWLASTDPAVMLSWAQGQDLRGDRLYPLSNRKLRLWVFAMRDAENAVTRLCPTRWHDPKLDDTRELAACVETWASGENSVRLVPMALRAALLRDIVGNPFRPLTTWPTLQRGDLVEAVPPFALVCGSGRYLDAVVVSTDPFALVSCEGDMLWTATATPQDVRKIGVYRYPKAAFKRWEREKKAYPPTGKADGFNPAWRTANVLALATSAYGGEKCKECEKWTIPAIQWENCPACSGSGHTPFNPDVLPALHDALLDAGCTDAAILNHLRATHWVCCCGKPRDGTHDHSSCGPPIEEPVPHVRGCWALDLILSSSAPLGKAAPCSRRDSSAAP